MEGKKRIALVAGGDSGEYVVSMESARMIRENIDPGLYEVYPVVIRGGKWEYTDRAGNKYPVNRNDFSIQTEEEKITFDCAFITIHGTPGEDGKLQGYFDLLGLPYTTAGTLASALTFNKYWCKLVAGQLGYDIPSSVRLRMPVSFTKSEIINKLGLPLFVKPNEGGSSLGMSLVRDAESLLPAIGNAFEYCNEVLVEEYIEGNELTCGAFMHKGSVKALPVTEIISKTSAQYFDFEAKYTPGAADEITPARIPEDLSQRVRDCSARLYGDLGLAGLVRFDYIYRDDVLYFLEVNITPGMTPTSIVPQQAEYEGISIRELFSMVLSEAIGR